MKCHLRPDGFGVIEGRPGLAVSAAVIGLLGAEDAPDFADPTFQSVLLGHWRDASVSTLVAE